MSYILPVWRDWQIPIISLLLELFVIKNTDVRFLFFILWRASSMSWPFFFFFFFFFLIFIFYVFCVACWSSCIFYLTLLLSFIDFHRVACLLWIRSYVINPKELVSRLFKQFLPHWIGDWSMTLLIRLSKLMVGMTKQFSARVYCYSSEWLIQTMHIKLSGHILIFSHTKTRPLNTVAVQVQMAKNIVRWN